MPRCLFLCFALWLGAASPYAQVTLERVYQDALLSRVIDLQHDGERRYLAEQQGRIHAFDGETYESVYLDIRDRVAEVTLEGGILSFAFHPDYAENGYVYVHYLAGEPRRSVIARFTRSEEDPATADPASELILLEVEQPMFNHNGGTLAFGPEDGYLYIAFGDGGNRDKWTFNGQDLTTLLGAVLRIDVDNPEGDLPYGIPFTNPFAPTDGPERDEIYAWGFRSPWRFSFDPVTGTLWLGDVGQSSWEEVDRVELGGNYGWDRMEGAHCYNPSSGCTTEGLTLPVWEYSSQPDSESCSVTGGYVYRGSAVSELEGHYMFGDFCSGKVWALDPATETATELLDSELLIASFGVDETGEIYVLGYLTGVHRLVRQDVANEGEAVALPSVALRIVGPNPVRGATTMGLAVHQPGPVRVTVYDMLGREVAVLTDGPRAAGAHPVAFDAANLAPGLYVVQARTPTATAAVRVTVVR